MARHPKGFDCLDAVEETLRQAGPVECLGRQEIAAAFGVGDMDGIWLQYKEEPGNGPTFGRLAWSALLTPARAIRNVRLFGLLTPTPDMATAERRTDGGATRLLNV